MQYQNKPFLSCGRIYNVYLPDGLKKDDPPINLASVAVNARNIKKPCILINYSQNLAFAIYNFNPVLSLVYRLLRKAVDTGHITILDQWTYLASEVLPTNVQEVVTIEPLVLNFCDFLDTHYNEKIFTYTVQISEITTQNATFNISNQEISGIVINGDKE